MDKYDIQFSYDDFFVVAEAVNNETNAVMPILQMPLSLHESSEVIKASFHASVELMLPVVIATQEKIVVDIKEKQKC